MVYIYLFTIFQRGLSQGAKQLVGLVGVVQERQPLQGVRGRGKESILLPTQVPWGRGFLVVLVLVYFVVSLEVVVVVMETLVVVPLVELVWHYLFELLYPLRKAQAVPVLYRLRRAVDRLLFPMQLRLLRLLRPLSQRSRLLVVHLLVFDLFEFLRPRNQLLLVAVFPHRGKRGIVRDRILRLLHLQVVECELPSRGRFLGDAHVPVFGLEGFHESLLSHLLVAVQVIGVHQPLLLKDDLFLLLRRTLLQLWSLRYRLLRV